MKRTILAAVLFGAPWPSPAAEAKSYELGVIVGEPTGVSGKMELADGTALDAAAAWSFSGRDKLSLHADKLWYRHDVFKVKTGRMPLYYGVGARLKLEDKSKVGVRMPVGAQYYLPDSKLTFFGELAPILDLAPDTDLEFSAAIGLRVVFD
jgi:hypothetical protein